MFMHGKNITSTDEVMQKINLEQLYLNISNPHIELVSYIEQLRIVLTLDAQKYRQLKTKLPYFVCGIFNKGVRRLANFSQISHFVLDFDHLRSKEIDLNSLKYKLMADSRISLMYSSPSNDGLKLVFTLSQPLFDAMQFKLFYKVFVSLFAKQYNIEQILDSCTCDVTRACFLSVDTDAYVNYNAIQIELSEYVNYDDFATIKDLKKELNFCEKERNQKLEKEEEKNPINNDILSQIKATLNPKMAKVEKLVYVPEQLNQIMEALALVIESKGIKLISVVNIQYGKQIKVSVNHFWAEINLFYGKRGFTIVQVTKTGSNKDLCDILQQIVDQFLSEYES